MSPTPPEPKTISADLTFRLLISRLFVSRHKFAMSDRSSTHLKTLLDDLVSQGTAPGLVAVAFDRKGAFASAAAGNKDTTSTSQPMTVDSIFWLASASKAAVSFVTLQLAEKHHIDLDSHEQLCKVVPELGKGWEGSQVWQLFDGKGEKGEWKFKEAKEGM